MRRESPCRLRLEGGFFLRISGMYQQTLYYDKVFGLMFTLPGVAGASEMGYNT